MEAPATMGSTEQTRWYDFPVIDWETLFHPQFSYDKAKVVGLRRAHGSDNYATLRTRSSLRSAPSAFLRGRSPR